MFVSGVTSLAHRTLSPGTRRATETKARRLAIIRDDEHVDASTLDELLLNMVLHRGWRFLAGGLFIILTGGVGSVLFVFWLTPSMISSLYIIWPIFALLFVGMSGAWSIGSVVADMRYTDSTGTLPETRAEDLFEGAGAIIRRPRWLLALNCSLVGVICVQAILDSLSTPVPGAEPIARSLILRYPWMIWFIPAALCFIILVQELVIRYERRRPPLRLTGQPDLARRADVYLRREGYKSVWESSYLPIPVLAIGQLTTVMLYPVAIIPVAILMVIVLVVDSFYSLVIRAREYSSNTTSSPARSPQ